jgi:hypothetical protein
MRPLDFWLLAGRMLVNEKNPAGFRSVISRSYGAFLAAIDFLNEMGIYIPNREQAHRRVLEILSIGDADIDDVGRRLSSLRSFRNLADYDLVDQLVETESNARLRHAEAADVIATINTCRQTIGVAGGRYETVKLVVVKRANKLLLGT